MDRIVLLGSQLFYLVHSSDLQVIKLCLPMITHSLCYALHFFKELRDEHSRHRTAQANGFQKHMSG
jgi:hypothetical protein